MKLLEDEEAERKMNEMNEKERHKALDCMLKVMDHQLDQIKASTNEICAR